RYTIRASLCAVAVNAAGVPSRAFIRRRKAPNAPWLRCRPWAAKRNAVAARFTPGRVRLDFTRPPVFFQLGHSPSQLQNFFTVDNCDTSGAISLMIVNAVTLLWYRSLECLRRRLSRRTVAERKY